MDYQTVKKELEDSLYELKDEQRTVETLLEAVSDIQDGIKNSKLTLLRNHTLAKEKLAIKIDTISDEVDDLADEIGSDYYVKTRELRRALKTWVKEDKVVVGI